MSADDNTDPDPDPLTDLDVEKLTKIFGEDPPNPVIKSPFQQLAEQLQQVANELHTFSYNLWMHNQHNQFSYFLLEFSKDLVAFSNDLLEFSQGNHIPDPIYVSNLKLFSKNLQKFSFLLPQVGVLKDYSKQLNTISSDVSNLIVQMGVFVAAVSDSHPNLTDVELPTISVLGEKRKDHDTDEESDSGATEKKSKISFNEQVVIFDMTCNASPADIAAAKDARRPKYEVHRRGPNEPLDTSPRTDANIAMNR